MENNRAILITGGTGLVGAAMCRLFLDRGYRVITTTRHNWRDSDLRKKMGLKDTGIDFHWFRLNLEDQDAVERLIGYLREKELFPDALIHCAINTEHLKVDEPDYPPRRSWDGIFLLDVIVAHELIMGLADQMGSRLKSVVNISSMFGITPPNPAMYEDLKDRQPPPVHYGVVKAAVIHLTRELAVRLAGRDIRVNCLSFGGVEGRADERFKERYGRYCPAGRMLRPEEVAGAAEFLISPDSSGMTGHNLVVDGGRTIW